MRLWKKIVTSFLAGGFLFVSVPAVSEAAVADEVQQYSEETVKEHNTAIPLTLGHTETSYSCCGGKLTIEGGYDFLLVRDEAVEKAKPELCQALIAFSDEARSGVLKDMARFEKWAEDFTAPERHPYNSRASIGVRRADARAVSVLGTYSQYTGGVHGDYGVKGENFDGATGAKLSFGDVCRDPQKFIDILEQKLVQEYPDASFFGKEEFFGKARENDGQKLNWTLENDGVAVWFSPYELTSYADGVLMVKVPFFGNQEMFNDYYCMLTAPQTAIPVNMPVDFAYQADGSHKRLKFIHKITEERTKIPMIEINGKVYEDPAGWGDELKPVLIHLDGVGVYYLYVFLQRADYYQLNVYDMNGEMPQKVAELSGMRPARYEDDFPFYELCTKPEKMILEKVTNALAGSYEQAIYAVGIDGKPVRVE